MSVFMSWSGESSRLVAEAWRTFLPNVIQTAEVWISVEDIEKSSNGQSRLRESLDESQIGIVCLTPDNLASPWLLFEAGALSKNESENTAYVCTYLVGLEPGNVEFPLAQFQSTTETKDDTRKLILTINQTLAESSEHQPRDEIVLNAFEAFWPEFQRDINCAKNQTASVVEKRDSESYFNEILSLVRNLPQDVESRIQVADERRITEDEVTEFQSTYEGKRLTTVEAEILLARAKGKSFDRISNELRIKKGVIIFFRNQILRKLGVKSAKTAIR